MTTGPLCRFCQAPLRHTLFILPWNFKDEIIEQMAYIRDGGGRFIVPIPEVRVV